MKAGKEMLVVAPTHVEGDEITAEIRQRLSRKGTRDEQTIEVLSQWVGRTLKRVILRDTMEQKLYDTIVIRVLLQRASRLELQNSSQARELQP